MTPSPITPAPSRFGNLTGAFADGAVLFPLLLALAWQTGASAAMLLTTTGLAYLATGWLFRLPIPVQPLKSLSIMAIAVSASAAEIRVAGIALGLIFLCISLANVDRLAARVPIALVRGFQLALGIMLMLMALRLLDGSAAVIAGLAVVGCGLLGLTRWTGWPVLGFVALGGLIWGVWYAVPVDGQIGSEEFRPLIVVLMVLPQIGLTLTNSVLGTHRAAFDYYGDRAAKVTPKRLLTSLGLGNLVVGSIGGMPYCHGSGGVTAHYRGGSHSWHSNLIIGGALLLLAGILYLAGGGLPQYPPALQALLLGLIGVFHLQLVVPSWRKPGDRPLLLSMGLAAIVFANMFAVLLVGLAVLVGARLWRAWRADPARPAQSEPLP